MNPISQPLLCQAIKRGRKAKMKPEMPLEDIYRALYGAFGHQHWWPADTAEEVVIGAVLAQNVAWENAQRAIQALKQNGLLSLAAIDQTDTAVIAPLIRPSRFYNQKAERLKNLSALLFERFGGSLEGMFATELYELRGVLKQLNGFGDETVDSILLYAAEKPIFVIDAYTRRIFARLGLIPGDWTYRNCQRFFMERLPAELDLYQDYHAQIVKLGSEICKKRRPRCVECPISGWCQMTD